ncbi:MAG: ABC transporter ATP-binding protein [Ignavibacteria bacterium]|nr:ABC transporter ATP-binding protein [Ignavibacteria bacterium]
MSTAAAVEISGIAKAFGALRAVDDLSMTIDRGEMFALVGPDGAGKTTTVRMLCGILKPDRGSASVFGLDVQSGSDEVKGKIGYLSQRFSLYGDLSIDENIEFFSEIHGVRDFHARREELLRFTRLTEFRQRLADRLSGGMRQKLALACTLIHTPDLLILDEPTTGVDPVSRRDFWVILQSLVREGMTIVLTTPYLDEAERCSSVALMNRGRIMESGRPAELRTKVDGEVLEIVCKPVRQAFHLLRSSESFTSVQAFGDRVNVVVRRSADDRPRVEEILRNGKIAIQDIRVVRPTLENLFISLMSRSEVSS